MWLHWLMEVEKLAYQIAHAHEFPLDLGRVPKKVRNAYDRVIEILKTMPERSDPPRIVRLPKYKGLWRLRIADDYRLVYRVEGNDVILLMIDHRSKVYDRLGIIEAEESAVPVEGSIDELLEPDPEVAAAGESAARHSAGQPLPRRLTPGLLASWGVPSDYHACFWNVRTEEELIELDSVPDEMLRRVLYGLYPASIGEVANKPVRVANSPGEIEAAADGKRSLASFLLKLDAEQKEFLSRFEGSGRPAGPWLLKGGPGSGKSTVALYCIKALLQSLHQTSLLEEDRPLRILYTTFTNSLVRASEHLLDMLEVDKSRHSLKVTTVDKLAKSCLPAKWRGLKITKEFREYILAAIEECQKAESRFSFTAEDEGFLREEIDWVLVGQGLESAEEYASFDRTGRGRALGRLQRRHLWQLYQAVQEKMRQNGECLFSERYKAAAESVAPQYDYIFVDEAQDLKAVAIRFLLGLCRNRSNIFLTADTNQSIWGNGFSWTKMASDLRMQGRARILRRNYRTTKEIWNAVLQLAPDSEGTDEETLNVEAVYRGPRPILARYDRTRQMGEKLNTFLHQALVKERASLGSAAVLCPSGTEMNKVMELLDKRFKPKAMRSNEVDISYKGVKVLTMHAAKGLEFPIVAVVGLERGRLPLPVFAGVDPEEHFARQRRLLFVACSRAMRRLIVFAHKDRPSPFVEQITDAYWEIDDED